MTWEEQLAEIVAAAHQPPTFEQWLQESGVLSYLQQISAGPLSVHPAAIRALYDKYIRETR